ncbi:MAG: hypothetical protein NTW60_03600 [Candidatus Wolfebacteria bacterium]|nr:hypothetical protein [Candidatus Wolfebacteria bacterium]
MDIFAHGLWTGVLAKTVNIKQAKSGREKLNIWWAIFWGIFPDIFAFTIPTISILIGVLSGSFHLSQLPHSASTEPPRVDGLWFLNLAAALYQLSHSIFIFAGVFLLVRFIFKKTEWEMAGWIFHILIDIPTHSYRFFPTPFLWPISGYKFDGLSWGVPWFMILNYSALALFYYFLYRRKRGKATRPLKANINDIK